MITFSIVVKTGYLRLCVYSPSVNGSKEQRYYRSLKKILVDDATNGFDKKRYYFYSNSKDAKRKNELLSELKTKLNVFIRAYTNCTKDDVLLFYDKILCNSLNDNIDDLLRRYKYLSRDVTMTYYLIEPFLAQIIVQEQKKLGSNYEAYVKLQKRLIEFFESSYNTTSCVYSHFSFDLIDKRWATSFADFLLERPTKKGGRNKGYLDYVKYLLSTLHRAQDKGLFDFKQLENINLKRYGDKRGIIKRSDTVDDSSKILTISELYKFLTLDIDKYAFTENEKREYPFLYDVAKFCLFTFVAPVDAFSLTKKNIGLNAFSFVRQKLEAKGKLIHPLITPNVRKLIKKYENVSTAGYILPASEILHLHYSKKFNNSIPKKSLEKLNKFLKVIGKYVCPNKTLTAYHFRRTAISVAVIGGINETMVTSWAGTSNKIADKHYIQTQLFDANDDESVFVLIELGHKEFRDKGNKLLQIDLNDYLSNIQTI